MSARRNWPGDADTVVRWVRESLRPDDAAMVRGLEDVRIAAKVSGTDLESLFIDASGVELSLAPTPTMSATASVPVAVEEPPVAQRSTGVLRSVRVTAAPVRIEQIPVSIDVQIYDAPVQWLVYERPVITDRPESIHGLELAEDGTGMRGALTASLRAADLTPLLTAVVRPMLNTTGIRLRRLSVEVVQDGAEGIRIEGRAGIRWRMLGASATGVARVGVSPGGIVTLRDLRIGSRNPLVAIALRAARRSVREQVGRSFDLNGEFTSTGGPRLSDVRVVAAKGLTVSARLS